MGILNSLQISSETSLLFQFTQGIDVDSRLAPQEIRVQKAWAHALTNAGIIAVQELKDLENALDEAEVLIKSGKFIWKIEDEDIHMNLERFLTERLGETGKRIHLGRSRNDLIATTLRLFVFDSLNETEVLLTNLIEAILDRAHAWHSVLIPGMTHLQSGQPIRMSSVFSSHGWALLRDIERVRIAAKRSCEVMPLGSAALAGTTVKVDLKALCKKLEFRLPPQNSYDSVGDRDFIIEALDAFASVGIHLSRLSEDCILWSSTVMGLLKLPAAWSTGSSMMPNKRNPDIPELVRAKSSHFMGATNQAHILLKGLPTSYDSDLHELKGIFIRAWDDLKRCLEIMVPFIKELQLNAQRADELLSQGHILATDIANELTLNGMSFREAYSEVAQAISEANARETSIEKYLTSKSPKNLTLEKFIQKLSFESSVESRNLSGGTSSAQVRLSLEKLRNHIEFS